MLVKSATGLSFKGCKKKSTKQIGLTIYAKIIQLAQRNLKWKS